MAPNVFAVPVLLVVFRETLEAVVVVAVLLAFLKQTLGHSEATKASYRSMVKQVWLGAGLGFLLCLIIGGATIGAFYNLGKNVWTKFEYYYEGVFYLIAALIITVVGIAFLRIGKMQKKWQRKISAALNTPVKRDSARNCCGSFSGKYAVFALSFITVAREVIEGIVFVAGVSFSSPASSVPLPVLVGLIAGSIVGWMLYKGSSLAKLQYFLVASTCLLYLVAAGLVARSVSYFEQAHWNKVVGADVAELGAGPGSYDIDRSVWHVNCCSPDYQGGYGWGIFNGILGWTNSATYSTVLSYNIYWILLSSFLILSRFREVKGRWPLMKRKQSTSEDLDEIDSNPGARSVENPAIKV
ncbi:iron permease FTR1 family protein [Ilyonectria sp. MPI-CAGE-AT-0026]|nr:iron permease FTR1 family protein [Ilyonectria sp. MPI-CAGE-AT-0026]